MPVCPCASEVFDLKPTSGNPGLKAAHLGLIRGPWETAGLSRAVQVICNISGAGCGNAGPAHTGTQMAFLDWSESLNTTTQTLTTVIGQTHSISYWVDDGQANFLNVTFGGSTLFNGTAPSSGITCSIPLIPLQRRRALCWPSRVNAQRGRAGHSWTMSA
jgi:hypothetical protein